MKKELPRVFSNPIEKEIKNNKDLYYGALLETEEIRSPKDISKKINEIFARKDFVYKKKVHIKTFDNEEEVTLVGRTNTSILTLDGQTIPIMSIMDINLPE